MQRSPDISAMGKISVAAVVDMVSKRWLTVSAADDDAIVYDISAAHRPSLKGRWMVKCQKEDAATIALAEVPVTDDAEDVDEQIND